MDFDETVANAATVLTPIWLILINWKLLRSKNRVSTKILLFVLSLLSAPILWLLTLAIVGYVLATAIPQNKFVNCAMLNEYNCRKRHDCEWVTTPALPRSSSWCGYKKK